MTVAKFLWNKSQVLAARKKGVRISNVERAAGDSLGSLYTSNLDKTGFIPRHQAVPCRISAVNSSGTYTCHEIDSHSQVRGERFQAAVNLGSGTPVVGDKVSVNVDRQGHPVFFFDSSDSDAIRADDVCTVKLASPNSNFGGLFAKALNDSSGGFSSTEEGYVEFNPSVDASTITAPTTFFKMILNHAIAEAYNWDGDDDTPFTFSLLSRLKVELLTSTIDCSTLTWNTKPAGTLLPVSHINITDSAAAAATSTGCSTGPFPYVDTADFTRNSQCQAVNVAQGIGESATIFGYRFYWIDATVSTPTGTWTYDISWGGFPNAQAEPVLLSLPGGGQFG